MGTKDKNRAQIFHFRSAMKLGRGHSDATNAEFTPTTVDGAVPAYQVMDLSASYQ
jgi:hypothetical protein